jgi:hypothetical protein
MDYLITSTPLWFDLVMFNYMIVVARSRIVEQHFGAISQWCVEREREREREEI